ncbi:MAG: amylo-alpha-1,6-glucosidase [Candidatus Woesearchaeota archaeon]|jgi:hypothetical protein
MNIIHNFNGFKIEKKKDSAALFLLANRTGGYLSLSTGKNISKYQGLYYLRRRNLLVKTIDSFIINKELTEIKNNFSNVERIYGDTIERFSFIGNSNSLVYEIEKYKGELTLQLDFREMYDLDDKGREYNIKKDKDAIIITYNKKEGRRYTVYVVIKGISDFDVKNNFVEQKYPFDEKRNSSPKVWWVYEGIKIKVNGSLRCIITSGDNLQDVKYEAEDVFSELDYKLEVNKGKKLMPFANLPTIPDKELQMAYINSLNAINDLTCLIEGKRGIYAGLWWFFQWWTRDEAISTKALMIEERYLYAKDMLYRQIENIFEDGRAPNIYPNEGLSSADGVGWSFKRLFDLILMVKSKKIDHLYFNEKDYSMIFNKLEYSLEHLASHYRENGFFKSGYNETWMDTAGDQRNGSRIEIQALILNMYKFASYLADIVGDSKKKELYSNLHDAFKKHIKDFFFSGFELADGILDKVVDFTARPNVFLTYYLVPQLLTKEEWERVFDNSLSNLIIEWGFDKCAIASIDRHHKQYIEEYSGENNISYHYGDVWYYINNITALCLFRLNKDKYKETIQKLIHTSTEEILWHGVIGFHAEISSAKEFRSEAALAQAWSSATYVELIHEIYSKKS